MSDELDVPDAYDDESFRAGYAQAMTHIGHMALQGADGISPGEADQTDAGDSDEADGQCRECDAPLLDSMGADETDASPAGTVCPNCDL